MTPTADNLYCTYFEIYSEDGELLRVEHETCISTSVAGAKHEFFDAHCVEINLGRVVHLETGKVIGGFQNEQGEILI